MRLLPRMRTDVHSQVAERRERLAARLADMRLLPRMRERVRGQVARMRERLAARLAHEAARRVTSSSMFGCTFHPRAGSATASSSGGRALPVHEEDGGG